MSSAKITKCLRMVRPGPRNALTTMSPHDLDFLARAGRPTRQARGAVQEPDQVAGAVLLARSVNPTMSANAAPGLVVFIGDDVSLGFF